MATKTADDIASLREALKTATPGTTIELEPGDYGKLGINAKYGDAWGRFAGEVTIRSADPNKPATFDGIFLRGVENLTIDGIVVDYTLPAGTTGDAINYSTAVLVQEVAEVTIRNSVFDGDVLDAPGALLGGLPAAQGLVVRESDAVVIADNEFQGFRGAANFQNSSDLVVSGNDVHTMRSEGFNLVTVQDVTIEDNYIHDFVTKPGVGDHRDMIQFWTAGARAPSTDIVIRDNVLDSGTGAWTQSIFMNNEAVGGGAGREMYYRNVVVENNVIYNAHYHGITVGHADGVTIAGNTVLHNRHVDMGNVSLPSINVTSDALNVRVTKNVSHNVPKPGADSAGWQIGDNLLVQNRAADKPNYYGDLFVDVMGGDTDLAGLKGLAGSVVERGGYGSTLPSAGEIQAGPGQGGQAPKPTPEPAPKPTPEPAPKPTPEPEPTPDPGSQDITFSLAIAYDTGVLVDDDLTDGEVLALGKLDDGPVTLVATPSEGVGSVRLDLVGVHESVENVTPYALFGDIDGDFFPGTRLDVGDYEMAVTAYSGANGSGSVLGSETISFSVADQPGSAPDASGVVHRWNAGPSTVEAADGGPDWVADAGAIAGSANLYGGAIASAGTLAATVPGTTPKGIFAHEYYGSSKSAGMGLEFGDGKLEDGSYAVRLYMGNGYAGTDDAGERVFDVSVEGEIFLDDLDLSGRLGHQVGGMFEWRGTVDDGTIDIDFAHVVENPLINAVEVIRLDDDLTF